DWWLPAAGDPLEPPWFRSSGALFAAVRDLGEEGRWQHGLRVLLLDTVIPFAYGWALFRAAWFYLRRLDAPAALARLRWVPVAAMLCDFAENACIATLLAAYPGRPGGVAAALLAFAWAKWALLALSVAGVLAATVLVRFRRPA
ncbi:MAG TPA: hypothetical protein VEW03_03350, partial [Longimicrobiaceae bacterium]|nr:hypothetical protein [Longimicrobiaceae bacterium]